MRTQADFPKRVVAVDNLKAMCQRVSGIYCHTYKVVKVSRSRVHVEYSNENEYAQAEPIVAIFPCYPNPWDTDKTNPFVVLDILNVLYDNWDSEGWQTFTPLLDCPELFRAVENGPWSTRQEIEQNNQTRKA